MCGIAGYLDWHRGGDAGIGLAMAERIRHRGPDAAGAWAEGPVVLAHRRLAILDLTPSGAQPMHSACDRYVMAFNGEIYNWRDLRPAIEQEAYFRQWVKTWRGHSDTEVILAAVGCWGFEEALRRMVGMFSIALWDRQEKALFLAVDRMGEKPLYYGSVGQVTIFGSELKALRACPGFQGEVDRGSLALLMRHNYIPAPYSIYRDVHKLVPGTYRRIGADGRVRECAYWSLAQVARNRAAVDRRDDTQAIDELESALARSIKDQMVADVPVGAFLSGGIDSSTVVALMQAQSARPVKTFSIGFQEQGFDEAVHARAVARHLGTDHTEMYVTSADALAVVPRLPELYDEPFSDSSQIPTFLVSRLARNEVTVSLSGDGGDELFGGYARYFLVDALWRKIDRFPSGLRQLAAGAVRALPPRVWSGCLALAGPFVPARYRGRDVGQELHRLAAVLGASGGEEVYRQLIVHWPSPAELVLGASEPGTALTDAGNVAGVASLFERMMLLDAISYLPGDILVKVDRAAMAVSLETRVPLLDHRVVELAWSLPLDVKVRDGVGKWILRQVLYRHVPAELFERPKMGFGVPIGQWLRGALREWAEDLIAEDRLRREGFFDCRAVRQKWLEHQSGRYDWQYPLWDVLMFQAWLETYGG